MIRDEDTQVALQQFSRNSRFERIGESTFRVFFIRARCDGRAGRSIHRARPPNTYQPHSDPGSASVRRGRLRPGDSMYPLLKSGDIVLYKEVPNGSKNIFWVRCTYCRSALTARVISRSSTSRKQTTTAMSGSSATILIIHRKTYRLTPFKLLRLLKRAFGSTQWGRERRRAHL